VLEGQQNRTNKVARVRSVNSGLVDHTVEDELSRNSAGNTDCLSRKRRNRWRGEKDEEKSAKENGRRRKGDKGRTEASHR
jgi:hypothetical protein